MRTLPLLAISLVLLAACGGAPSSQTPAAPAADAKLAPDFELKDVSGKTVKLSDSNGTVRLVDFWATWCSPCREEIPMFKDLHARYGSRGLTLIGIAMDDEGSSVVEPFVRENAMPYLNLLGNEDVASAYGPLRGLPTKFLVDREGRIVATYFGPVPRKVLESKIESLLHGGRELVGS
jgi:cytochrome c biogenesis protein CcmG/thiol:disulfide interchange protein DsbE